MIGKVEKVKRFNVFGLPFSNNINITMWSDRIRTLHWAGYIQIVRDQRLSIFSQIVLWNSSLNNHAKLSQNYLWELGWYSGNNNNKKIYLITYIQFICIYACFKNGRWNVKNFGSAFLEDSGINKQAVCKCSKVSEEVTINRSSPWVQ